MGQSQSTTGLAKLENYVYEPLDTRVDSIRLLQITGWSGRRIQCSLKHARVSESTYVALSYMWGPKSGDFEIIVDGMLMKIQSNLHSFLHNFIRQSTFERSTYLWIDAICLDQTNVVERNHQVQQMHTIYRNANTVLSWLGTGDAELTLRLKSIAGLSSLRSSQIANDNLDVVRAKMLVFRYWSRLWVVQELALSRRTVLMYGDQLLSWDQLWPQRIPATSVQSFKGYTAYIHYDIRLSMGVQPRFESLLEKLQMMQCEDPRDRIFGSLALVEKGLSFSVSYDETPLRLALRAAQHFDYHDIHLLQKLIRLLELDANELLRITWLRECKTGEVADRIIFDLNWPLHMTYFVPRASVRPRVFECSVCRWQLRLSADTYCPPFDSCQVKCLRNLEYGHMLVVRLRKDSYANRFLGPLNSAEHNTRVCQYLDGLKDDYLGDYRDRIRHEYALLKDCHKGPASECLEGRIGGFYGQAASRIGGLLSHSVPNASWHQHWNQKFDFSESITECPPEFEDWLFASVLAQSS